MKAASASVYGVLAALGLVFAYVTSQREAAPKEEGVVALDISRRQLQSVIYQDERSRVELLPKDAEVWLSIRTKGTQETDGGTVQESERLLRGNAEAQQLVQHMAPLQVSRSLGKVGSDSDKLREWGFDKSVRSLEIRYSGGVARYQVGNSPLGPSWPYLRSEKDGEVFVLGNGGLAGLEGASSQLVDRRLHAFPLMDADQVSIRFDKNERRFSAVTEHGSTSLTLEGQTAPDAFAQNWHRRVWQAIAVDVLGKNEVPKEGIPEVKARVDYLQKGKPLGFTELAVASGETFVRTEHTVGWEKLTKSSDSLLGEAEKVATTVP